MQQTRLDLQEIRDTLTRYSEHFEINRYITMDVLEIARQLVEHIASQTDCETSFTFHEPPAIDIPPIEMPSRRKFREMETLEVGDFIMWPVGVTTNQLAKAAQNPYHKGKRFVTRTKTIEGVKRAFQWRVE